MKTPTLAQKVAAIAVPAALVLMAATPAFAATASSTAQAKLAARSGKISTTADAAITKRITTLTSLSTRVNALVHVSADQKASLTAAISTESSTLSALDTKIKADTDAATEKADAESVTKDNRIYELVVPQVTITAAADRALTVGDMITALGTKLQARITAAGSAGTDVTALNASFTDMNAQIADGTAQANAALTAVTGLTPDNGDATVEASNTAAIKGARADLQTAQKDFVAARKDVASILAGIKGKGTVSASASTSAAVSQ